MAWNFVLYSKLSVLLHAKFFFYSMTSTKIIVRSRDGPLPEKKKKIWNCCVYIALWRHMFIFIILLLAAGLSNDQIQFLRTL